MFEKLWNLVLEFSEIIRKWLKFLIWINIWATWKIQKYHIFNFFLPTKVDTKSKSQIKKKKKLKKIKLNIKLNYGRILRFVCSYLFDHIYKKFLSLKNWKTMKIDKNVMFSPKMFERNFSRKTIKSFMQFYII